MDDINQCSININNDNLSKCCKCNDAPGDLILETCLHNLCSYCVTSCLEARDMYICPLCSSRSKIASNIFLPMLGKVEVDNCNWCEVGNERNCATGYCGECDASLCSECIKGHCRMPQFRAHYVKVRVETDGKGTRNCDSHPNEALEIYCETCEKLTCRDCQLSLHKEHRHQWIGEKARELETALATLTEQLLSTVTEMGDLAASVTANKDALAESTARARNDIDRYVALLKRCQETFLEGLYGELGAETALRERRLVDIGAQISKAKESMQHCLGLLQKASSSREPALLVQLTPRLLAAVAGILARHRAEHGPLQPFLDLEYSECRFVPHAAPADLLKAAAHTQFGTTAVDRTKAELATQASGDMKMEDYAGDHSDEEYEVDDDVDDDDDVMSGQMCSVCDEPGLVVCCSGCERLFHPQCHLPRLPQSQQTSPDWLCTSCACVPRASNGRFVLEASDRSLPHRGRLNKKERRAASRVFLELLQFRDWSLFVHGSDGGGVKAMVGGNSGRQIDFERIRFNLENKIYTGIDKFVSDVHAVFENTLKSGHHSPRVTTKVYRFQERFNSLLHKYIPGECKLELHRTLQ